MPATIVSVAPSTLRFGDLAVAVVRGSGQPSFAPFLVRGRDGNRYVIQCLDPRCAPPRTLRLGDAQVRIVPRATSAEVATPLRSFTRETARLPTTFTVAPGLLLGLLAAGAVLCLAAAAAVARPLAHRLARAPRDTRTPLERALALARASVSRGDDDRRRALDLLGRLLRGERARDALDLAWSERDPTPDGIERLLEQVER